MSLGKHIVALLLEERQYTIGVFPGAFKPPHKGHFNVVKKLATMCDEVNVLISPKTRDGVTVEESAAVWELYKTILPANVNYLVVDENPVRETYKLITDNPDAKIIAAFGKDEYTRFNSILSNEKYSNAELFNAGNFDNVSATDFRIAIKAKDENLLKQFIPEGITVQEFMNAAGYTMPEKDELKEGQENLELLKKFISFTLRELGIEGGGGKIVISKDTEKAREMKSMGLYSPQDDKIWVYTGNRNMADICRTVSHELVHLSQKQKGQNLDGTTGSDTENEANATAGKIMRKFAQTHPMIFEGLEQKQQFTLYCDMDGVLVDFEKGYEELTGKNIKGQHVKGDGNFWKPISDAGEKFWTDLQWMPDGKQLWDYIQKDNPILLSAPSRERSSTTGKEKWVAEHIPGAKLILRAADKKQEFAHAKSILIDDREDNITRWQLAGGIGIHHSSAIDTINKLKELGL
jgi:cytidyltransferase-like protein